MCFLKKKKKKKKKRGMHQANWQDSVRGVHVFSNCSHACAFYKQYGYILLAKKPTMLFVEVDVFVVAVVLGCKHLLKVDYRRVLVKMKRLSHLSAYLPGLETNGSQLATD